MSAVLRFADDFRTHIGADAAGGLLPRILLARLFFNHIGSRLDNDPPLRDSPLSQLRECDRYAKDDARLRSYLRTQPISHPLTRYVEVQRRQSRTHHYAADSHADWQHSRGMTLPADRPRGIGRSQIPTAPKMNQQDWLELHRVLRRAVRGRVRE